MPRVQLHLGDCREVLKGLDAGSVDAVVTDPPYGTGAWLRPAGGAGSDCRAEHRLEDWDCWSTDWLNEAERVSRGAIGLFLAAREIGSLLAWIGHRPWRMFAWVKSDPRPRFSGQPAYGFDPFVVIGKVQPVGGKDYILASSPRPNRDREATGHPHQKRVSVMKWAARLVCPEGGTILDPFLGSGSTGVAAVQLGFNFIGIELDPTYHAIARRRIDAALNEQPLFAGTGS